MPDSKRLLISSKAQHYSLYQVEASGTPLKQLVLDTGRDVWPLDISPDGRFVLYGQGLFIGRARSQLWVFPLRGGGPPLRLLEGDAVEADGQFSPKGSWVAYTSNQSGRNEVYIGEFLPGRQHTLHHKSATAKRWQVSSSGGRWPRWRRDGKELFYISDDNVVMAVPITTRGLQLEIGVAHPLFHTSPDPTSFPYDITADGSRFLINTTPPEKTAPITLVENWLFDLKK